MRGWVFGFPGPSPPNVHVEALPHRVMVFADGACEGLKKVKWGQKDGALTG